MAKGPDGPSGGYPNFIDPGGPVGSDIIAVLPGEEDNRLKTVIDETATPLPVEDPDRLFDLSVGVVEKSQAFAREATQRCLHEITQAPHRFYEGNINLASIITNVRKLARLAVTENEKAYGVSECKRSCILAELGKCPLAMLDFEISEPAFAELIGIQIRSKSSPKKEPAGVTAFKLFSNKSFSVRPPGMPAPKEEQIQEASASKHIFDWWSKYRPKKVRQQGPAITSEQSTLQL
ncbi:MAG: hypothetical protein H6799_02740 [Candidatus Nomurabacteria bacterium]|nr:MAG: hypothetical protein H6799_02740 [Candidatus Nomurabacteria bacterium]HRV75834.1 hypothetical protein [Candidatus Saccharimonadales bacterium]